MTLSTRALNRASLQRQLLLERRPLGVESALDHLVGLQGQVPTVPYIALWSRLEGFAADDLAGLMHDRAVVRSPLMRTTIHTVTADDALGLWPLMAPVLARTFAGTAWGRQLRGHDLTPAVDRCRQLVADRPLTRAALATHLAADFPDLDATALAWAFSYHVAHVQATPRGLWGRSGASALTTTEHWLGRDLAAYPIAEVVERYLRAFGPATVMDVQAWCGLTRLREVTDAMELRRLPGPDGAVLLDVPDGPMPDPDTPAPVRFLPEYDNALLSYADRSRWSSGATLTWLQGGPGGFVGTVLVDGTRRATWAARPEPGALELEVRGEPALLRSQRADVQGEGHALLEFLAPHVEHRLRMT